jgi:hypothetical protein
MKGLIAGLIVLALLISLNGSPVKSGFEPQSIPLTTKAAVNPSLIQDTISQIQQKEQNVFPIDTVYYNSVENGYQGRFLFLDTDNYAGVQYDVNVDSTGSIVGDVQKSVPANYQNPFSGYAKNFPFGNLNAAPPTPDMAKVWDNYTVKI